MNSKRVLLVSIVVGIICVFILFVLMEQAATVAKNKEAATVKKEKQMINDAYILGASVYRAQALMLVEDSIITRMDTLFIWETKDINDSLAVEAAHNFDL